MWDEKELLKQIDEYFNNITEELFFKDIESAGCLDLIEDVSYKPKIVYSEDLNNIIVKASTRKTKMSNQNFTRLSEAFNLKGKTVINNAKIAFLEKNEGLAKGA